MRRLKPVADDGRVDDTERVLTPGTHQLEVDGQTYEISTDPFEVKGKSDATESALEIGGGAVVGGVLRGAKGAIVGAAIGTGVAVATEGDQLRLGAGQRLRIRLTEPVTVQFRPRPETEH